MKLSEILLQKLSNWQPAGAGPHLLAATDEDNGWTLTVRADRAETMGCLLWGLTLKNKTPAQTDLRPWATQTAARVTGLLEPLAVIEVDATRGEALLRSHEPSKRGEQLFYYEALLKSTGEAAVCRYQADHEPSHRRQQVPFALTHEVLAKLAEDIATQP